MGGGVSLSHVDDNAKAKGDTCFKLQDYHHAIYWYTVGISETVENEKLSILLSNRAAAYFECECYEKSLSDAEEVCRVRPDWCKGYFRASKAAFALDRQLEALRYVDKAIALTPNDTSLVAFRNDLATSSSQPYKSSPAATGPTWAYAWGCDDSSQLGLGLPNCSKSLPSPINAFRGIHLMYVSCGASHTVAICSQGDCYSWGNNGHCQLGVTTTDKCVAVPVLIPALVGLRIVACCCGAGHNVVVTDTGKAYSWGINRQGQCGLGHTNNQPQPTLIDGIGISTDHNSTVGTPIAAVSCGLSHTMMLLTNGSLAACGSNQFGQLGDATLPLMVTRPTVVVVMGSKYHDHAKAIGSGANDNRGGATVGGVRVSHVACGGAHTVIIDAEGRVYSAGSNSCGQLGRSGNRPHPASLADANSHQQGSRTSPSSQNTETARGLGLVITGQGLVSTGQGLPDFRRVQEDEDSPNFELVMIPFIGSSQDALNGSPNSAETSPVANTSTTNDRFRPCSFAACGEEFSCVISRDRSVYAWGLGIAGQMGDGALNGHNRPHLISELEDHHIEELVCSQGQVLAVSLDGMVYMWGTPGDQAHIALIDPSVIKTKPEKIATFSKKKKIHAIACGRKHYVLLLSGIYAPQCFVSKGLGVRMGGKSVQKYGEGDEVSVEELASVQIARYMAGDKISMLVQCVDLHGEVCDSSSGVKFRASIEHESIDYQYTYQKQCGIESELGLPLPAVVWDDNLDGTIEGCTRLYVTGVYDIAITLDQQPIKNSPFHVEIFSGPVHPPSCDVWWGAYVISHRTDTPVPISAASASIADRGATTEPGTTERGNTERGKAEKGKAETAKTEGGILLQSCVGSSMVFSVSLRDKYRNRVHTTDLVQGLGVRIKLIPMIVSPISNKASNKMALQEGKIDERKGIDDDNTSRSNDAVRNNKQEQVYTFLENINGVIPCICVCPSTMGDYHMIVSLVGYDGRGDDIVRQATLIVTASTAASDTPTAPSLNATTTPTAPSTTTPPQTHAKSSSSVAETPAAASKSYLHLLRSTPNDPSTHTNPTDELESQQFLQTVNGLETTRKRARDALLRQQAQLARDRQATRHKKESMRRTGGGFVVQYSKDI